ncbi:MAG: NAD-dependent dehydratase [Gammaproteobacteria bacterium]|nr:NAD-dependent dehydratase [Gammaproteobacteria bacterium]
MKTALVCGAGGFIGTHLVKRLRSEGLWVRGVDLKLPEFDLSDASDFMQGDLRDEKLVQAVFDRRFDEVYQLAADMGGAGYIFTGDNDASILHNSAVINLNVLEACRRRDIGKVFYASSACVYPEHNQLDPLNPNCEESSAYPANPDSEYGWEKLFSERLYLSYARNYGLEVRIARFHNIFGELSTWQGGKEKVPAALCRKIALAADGETIEVWGDGTQTRSFLYIDECMEGILRLMRSGWSGPVNIGSDEMVCINELAAMIMRAADKNVFLEHIPGPEGVRGRNSDNRLIKKMLGWRPSSTLYQGIVPTYRWIQGEVQAQC